ncbi:hypothetical protein BH11VER1_BH11VER1_06090 [soil metagenome]
MLWARWIIFGIPLSLILLTVWSANQTKDFRAHGTDIVIASAEAVEPSLNPFLPSCEADRQMMALLHASLLRVADDGTLQGSLAEKWQWLQSARYWFADASYAEQAATKLRSLEQEHWKQWHLTTVDVNGTELKLGFSNPGGTASKSLQQVIAEFGPLPVETLRIELKEPARAHHEAFLKTAAARDLIKQVWFEGTSTYEMKVSGETLKLVEELDRYYDQHPVLKSPIRQKSKDAFLPASALEFTLRRDAIFHDGSPVTSRDVASSARLALSQPWPIPGRELLELVRAWDTRESGKLKVEVSQAYGPLLTAFVGLPVLPQSWIEKHQAELATNARVFRQALPPGAGVYQIEKRSSHEFLLRRNNVDLLNEKTPLVHWLVGDTPAVSRIGFANKSVDMLWPDALSIAQLAIDPEVKMLPAPLHNRLLVLWNCRRSPLDDPAIRRTLGLAVDRSSMVQEFIHGQGGIHEGLFQPGLWTPRKPSVNPGDPLKALETLGELGWIKDRERRLVKEGTRFRIELLTVEDNADRLLVAKKLKEEWERLGIEVVIVVLPRAELFGQRLSQHDFDAVLLGMDFEMNWDQRVFWHSGEAQKGLNYAGIADEELDRMLDALQAEFDVNRVPQLASEMEQRLMSLHPFLPLFSGGIPLAVHRQWLDANQEPQESFNLLKTVEAMKRTP